MSWGRTSGHGTGCGKEYRVMQKQDLFVEVRGHRYVVIEKRRQYQAIPERYGRKRDASAATTNTEIRAIARELAAR
jgi:hypothetical protein